MAIKTFAYTPDSDIQQEARTMKMATHENIVKFLALERIGGNQQKLALVMEYCSRGNLHNFIDSQPKGLESAEFLRVFGNLLSAIKHMHSIKLVHRDIKPLNILISSHVDGSNVYKLADFGSARFLKQSARYSSLHGTFEYLHPDLFGKFYADAMGLIKSKQTFTAIHELWSIGVTLYESATGRLPFNPKKGRNDPKVMYDMMAKKQPGHIAAEESSDGKIVWSTELPTDCRIDMKMIQDITPLLASLMSKKCSFQSYFHQAEVFLGSAFADDQKENTVPIGKNKKKRLRAKKGKTYRLIQTKRPKRLGNKNPWYISKYAAHIFHFPHSIIIPENFMGNRLTLLRRSFRFYSIQLFLWRNTTL